MAVGEGTQQHLVAYICANGGSLGEDDVVRLKQYLTKQLPAYMVPQSYTFVEAIPLNQNGKYDRSALRALTKLDIDHTYVAPRNKLEEQLEALWCELLDLEKVSVTANFFSVGGQSLIAIRMVNELSKILSIELETRYIFEYSSIESLALLISNSGFYNNGVVEESDDVIEFEI